MKEPYWDQFMMTGKIEDYLSYKMHQGGEENSSSSAGGKEKRESDCTDRHGALHHAGGRI